MDTGEFNAEGTLPELARNTSGGFQGNARPKEPIGSYAGLNFRA